MAVSSQVSESLAVKDFRVSHLVLAILPIHSVRMSGSQIHGVLVSPRE